MKTFVVYIHLLAACISVGNMLVQDFALARKRGAPLLPDEITDLTKAVKVISFALITLWITGIGLVVMGYLDSPDRYFTNQKLWAKISVVVALTVNGYFLHNYSFPRVASENGILGISWDEQVLVALTGAVSSVSWLFACYLGIARPWNYTVDYSFIMSLYLLMLSVSFVSICAIMHNMRLRYLRSK